MEIRSQRAGGMEVAAWAKVSQPHRTRLSVAVPLPYLPLANVDGNEWTNSREMCLAVARRITEGFRFVFQEPRSSLKAISQLRNETPEIAQEQE